VLPDLATSRLALTPVGQDDLELLRALNADADVMRHLGGRPLDPDETDREWSQRLGERSDPDRGLGYWVGRIGDEFVGWWGLGACSWDDSTANLGYRLHPSHWGTGLATEGGRALLAHGFETVGLASVWASTRPENAASRRVLEKLGLRYVGLKYEQSQYEIRLSGS